MSGDGFDYPYIQLWNPSDSGIDMFVYRIALRSDEAGYIWFFSHDAVIAGTGTKGRNRKLGAVNSQADMRTSNATTISLNVIEYFPIQANDNVVLQPAHLWIPPGYGLLITSPSVTVTISASIVWFEFVEF
jgi:hypothetical protein